MKYILSFLVDFINIVNEMSPYLMLGFFFAGILKVLFPQKMIDKYLGSNNNRSVINACLIGIPLPLCSCGVIPTGMSFYKSGASKGASVAFLISTPQTGIDSILVTYSLLGLPFTIIRPLVALITGIIGGNMSNKFEKLSSPEIKINISEDTCSDSCCDTKATVKNNNIVDTIRSILKYAFVDFLQDIAKWLIMGLVLAATISVLLPKDFFIDYIANDFLGMLIMLIASIPLYICATSSVPVAAVLMMKGLSPGAALVFLMAGPATNAATITVMNKVMGKKTTIIYLFAIIIGALGFGFLIDNFIPREWFLMLPNIDTAHAGHQHTGLPIYLQWASSISLFLLIINAYRIKYNKKNSKNIIENKPKNSKINFSEMTLTQHKTIKITGMTCNHCKNSVEKHISLIKNINKITVNLEQEIAYIEGYNISLDIIKEKVESLGFKYIGEIKDKD